MSEQTSIQDFLNSGKLEQYLLGVDEQHANEVERMIQEHQEVAQAYEQAQRDLFIYADSIAAKPPSHLQNSILTAIDEPTMPSVTSLQTEDKNDKNSNVNWLSIAAMILALVSLGGLWYTNNQNELLREEITAIKKESDGFKKDLSTSQSQITDLNEQLYKVSSAETKKYILANAMNTVKAVIYHNDQDNFANLEISSLPPLDSEHDYQLWADIEGEMISLAVIDGSNDNLNLNPSLLKEAVSINLTVEKAGGSYHATVANLVANVVVPAAP